VFALPALPTACATTPSCANGGEFDAACKCRCPTTALWSGSQCDQCTTACQNGGQARTARLAASGCRHTLFGHCLLYRAVCTPCVFSARHNGSAVVRTWPLVAVRAPMPPEVHAVWSILLCADEYGHLHVQVPDRVLRPTVRPVHPVPVGPAQCDSAATCDRQVVVEAQQLEE